MKIKIAAVVLLLLAFAVGKNLYNKRTSASQSFSSLSDDHSLILSLLCEAQCGDDEVKASSYSDIIFDPIEQGLRPGNGNLMGSLSVHLWMWADHYCLAQAKRFCAVKEVRKSSLKQITSGRWAWAQAPRCTKSKTVLSPFDRSSGSDLLARAFAKGPSPKMDLQNVPLIGKKENCSHPQKLKVCFGDCMDITCGQMPETLCTKEPAANEEQTLCLDDLDALPKLQWVDEERLRCERAVLKTISNGENGERLMTAACAAFRWDSFCADYAAEKLKK